MIAGCMVIFGVASIALWWATSGIAPDQIMQSRQITSSHGKWKITIPAAWTWEETPRGANGDLSVTAIISEPSASGMGIYGEIRELKQPKHALSSVSEWGQEISRLKSGYKMISLEPRLIGDESTLTHVYSYETPSFPQGTSQINCINSYRSSDLAGYILTLCTDQERYMSLERTFLQTIDSFSF